MSQRWVHNRLVGLRGGAVPFPISSPWTTSRFERSSPRSKEVQALAPSDRAGRRVLGFGPGRAPSELRRRDRGFPWQAEWSACASSLMSLLLATHRVLITLVAPHTGEPRRVLGIRSHRLGGRRDSLITSSAWRIYRDTTILVLRARTRVRAHTECPLRAGLTDPRVDIRSLPPPSVGDGDG